MQDNNPIQQKEVSDPYTKALEAGKTLFSDYPDVVTTLQVCKMLNIGKRKVYELINSGDLRKLSCNKRNRVLKADVIIYALSLRNDK